jgi:hypothetical protein
MSLDIAAVDSGPHLDVIGAVDKDVARLEVPVHAVPLVQELDGLHQLQCIPRGGRQVARLGRKA